MSKWIEDAEQATIWESSWGEGWIKLLPILEKIDKLLRQAARGIEDENLYDRIMNEIGKEE